MALASFSLSLSLNFQLTREDSFGTASSPAVAAAFNLADAPFTEGFAEFVAVPAGATVDFDFFDFVNLIYEESGLSRIWTLLILPEVDENGTVGGTADASIEIKPGATNPLTWFFRGTDPRISLPVNGVFLYSLGADADGQSVDATHRNIRITNTGDDNLIVTVGALGQVIA